MAIAAAEMREIQTRLVRKQAELIGMLHTRDHIAIEKSADQMDEIQGASERDLAVQNAGRDSTLLRHVKIALQRIGAQTFGDCLDCDHGISPKRLAAVPWALRCIHCQEIADREGQGEADLPSGNSADAGVVRESVPGYRTVSRAKSAAGRFSDSSPSVRARVHA